MELRCYHPHRCYCPDHSYLSAEITAFSRRRPLFPRFVPEVKKAVSDVFDDFPSFKRSYRTRNFVRSSSMVTFSLSLSSICRKTLYSSGSARRKYRQTTSSSMSEPFERILRTFLIIAAKTGMGLAPGLTRLGVSDWRHCTWAPGVDALYVSTSARHPAAGEEAWRKISRSPLLAIARDRMFQAMKCFCIFSWGKASC